MKLLMSCLVLVIGCAPVREQMWAYNPPVHPYDVHAMSVTPQGIHFDPSGQDISGALIDRLTDEVEMCLQKSIDRGSFVVKIPSNWSLSCDKTQQLLTGDDAPNSGCDAKGLPNKEGCPCSWRARMQWPNVVVTTPSFYLYKDALTRFVTRIQNPWADPWAVKCVTPSTSPLSTGAGP
jgi:hypothetical protein